VLAGSIGIYLHELRNGVNFTEDALIEALDQQRRGRGLVLGVAVA